MIWVVGAIVGALVACIGVAANTAVGARKEILTAVANDLGRDLSKSQFAELEDMRRDLNKKALTSRVVFSCMWWGGVILFGVSLYMLTHQ